MANAFCPNCGFEVRAHARFCASCGTPLQAPPKEAAQDTSPGSPAGHPGNKNQDSNTAAGLSFNQSRAATEQFAAGLSALSGIPSDFASGQRPSRKDMQAEPTTQQGRDSSAATSSDDDDDVEPDGWFKVASMAADGTITIQLRAVCDGIIGEGKYVYPPDHPEYQKVLQEVGGLRPGEHKTFEGE